MYPYKVTKFYNSTIPLLNSVFLDGKLNMCHARDNFSLKLNHPPYDVGVDCHPQSGHLGPPPWPYGVAETIQFFFFKTKIRGKMGRLREKLSCNTHVVNFPSSQMELINGLFKLQNFVTL
jgi:hypothetical protein